MILVIYVNDNYCCALENSIEKYLKYLLKKKKCNALEWLGR